MILLLVLLQLVFLGMQLYSGYYSGEYGLNPSDHWYGISVWGFIPQLVLLYFIVTI